MDDMMGTTLFEKTLSALIEKKTAEVTGIVDERQTKRETNKALKAQKTEAAAETEATS